jgi:hypothetical protein
MDSGDLEEGEEHYLETVEEKCMKGTAVLVEAEGDIGREVLDYVNEKWSNIANKIDVERTIYVAGGLTKMASVSRNDDDAEENK